MPFAIQRFVGLVAAGFAEIIPTITGGAAAAGQIAALGPDGTLHATMMPPGVAADTAILPFSEAVTAPALVNIFVSNGVETARNADGATQGKSVDGYVLASVAANGTGTVYMSSGIVPGFTGLTLGDAFLSTTAPGAVAAAGATSAGQTYQRVGKALSATVLQFTRGEPVARN